MAKELLSNWIWVNEPELVNPDESVLVYFRKEFTLDEVPESLMIRVSGDTRYKLFVNGAFAEFGPVKGDKQLWYVDSVEIAQYLQPGVNVLAAELLRYPEEHNKGNHGMFRTDMPGFYLAEESVVEAKRNAEGPTPKTDLDYLPVEDGEGHDLSAGETWKYHIEKNFRIVCENPWFSPLWILEDRAGDDEAIGWKKAGFDDSKWDHVKTYTDHQVSQAVSPGNLSPRTIPFLKKDLKSFISLYGKKETATPEAAWNDMLFGAGCVTIPAHSHEIVEIDAGEEMTGFLSLRMGAGRGSDVKIMCAEAYIYPAKNVDSFETSHPTKGDRTDCENGVLMGYSDTYHVNGFGSDTCPEEYAPFWFRTFRYLQLDIETGDEPLTIYDFDYRETGYPLEAKTTVNVSDETLAPVWDISLRTLKRCMHETYEDCPYYEQLQYAMDSRSQILYTYAVSADDRLARKCMDDFRRSQRYDGMTNCSYPCTGPNVIPGFSIYYIMMLYDHMMYFGDKKFLQKHLGAVDGILEYFRNLQDDRGIVKKNGGPNGRARYWSFIDWTLQWRPQSGVPTANLTGPITMESLLYIMGLDAAADVNEYLGRMDTAAEYRTRADEVRAAVNKYCTGANGMIQDGPGYEDYSQHCQVFAAITNTVTGERARKNLEITLDHKDDYAQCSVAMAYYLFRALKKTGMYERTDECWNVWRKMVENKLTTCVEDGVNGRSDCHAWGALALYELPSVVLGVRPAAPGYEKIAVEPHPGYMTSASGDVITPRGMVHVEWKKNDDGTLDVKTSGIDG